jgi:hypothetical protein
VSARASRRVAVAWALAFGVLAVADLTLILCPAWPLAVPIAISLCGLGGAAVFTKRDALRAGIEAG